MIAQKDRPSDTAELAARLPRMELERLFLGVIAGLLDDEDRQAVDEALWRWDLESPDRESHRDPR